MHVKLTLHQQRKKLNQIFDLIINHSKLSEEQFDKAMQKWVIANEKLESKEEQSEEVVKKTMSNVYCSQQKYHLFSILKLHQKT